MTAELTPPRFLYHGTSARAAEAALRDGIQPRKAHRRSNWKQTVESNPDTVYLTDAYPIYFALNAAERNRGRGAVLQIDVERLDQLWLVPDEDVLEQAGRGVDDVPGSMRQRTLHWRARMADYLASDAWLKSLAAMGTCGSMKPIPREAITRVAFINFRECRYLAMAAGDAMICLANYRFCAPKYRGMTNRLFGLEAEDDPLDLVTLPPITADMPDSTKRMLEQMAEQRRLEREAMDAEFAKVVHWPNQPQERAA